MISGIYSFNGFRKLSGRGHGLKSSVRGRMTPVGWISKRDRMAEMPTTGIGLEFWFANDCCRFSARLCLDPSSRHTDDRREPAM